MKKFKNYLLTAVAVTAIVGLTGCAKEAKTGGGSDKSDDTAYVKIGVVGENNEQWDYIAKQLKEEGIEIELVKFADYS